MTRKTAHWISAILLLASVVVAALAYPGMPEQVATHWNAAGEADGYSSKLMGVAIGPLGAAFTWLIIWLLPHISPKGYRTEGFAETVNVLQVSLVGFMVVIGGIIIAAAYGYEVAVERFIPGFIGALFIVTGNYLAKTRKNFFIGIRTPWTLASDEVWMRTHRLGGYTFFISGVVMLAIALFNIGFSAAIVGIAVTFAAIVPAVYSYFLYRKLEGFSDETADAD